MLPPNGRTMTCWQWHADKSLKDRWTWAVYRCDAVWRTVRSTYTSSVIIAFPIISEFRVVRLSLRFSSSRRRLISKHHRDKYIMAADADSEGSLHIRKTASGNSGSSFTSLSSTWHLLSLGFRSFCVSSLALSSRKFLQHFDSHVTWLYNEGIFVFK